MREVDYFVEVVETRRGRRARHWREQLRNVAVTFALAILVMVLVLGCIDAYAALAAPFPLI